MLKKHAGKLNKSKGFSLTELLVAVLILGMVSSVVAGGIPVARDAYQKVTLSANAQVMLSTAIAALRNELCTASNVDDSSENELHYYNGNILNDSWIKYESGIVLCHYNKENTIALVSDAVGDRKLKVICEGMSYDASKGIVTITGLRVVDKDDLNKVYAYMDGEDKSTLMIRVITDQEQAS